MLRDDRIDYPMELAQILTFKGHPDTERLHSATKFALGRHPLLTARIARLDGRLYWVQADEPMPPEVVEASETPDFPRMEKLNLYHTRGCRLVMKRTADGFMLLVQVHHAVCDGLGLMQFISDLFDAYAGKNSASPRLDANLLTKRGRVRSDNPLTPRKCLRLLPAAIVWLLWTLCYFMVHAKSLIPTRGNDSKDLSKQDQRPSFKEPAIISHRFDRKTTEDLSKIVHTKLNTTLNTLLLCELHRTMAQWRLDNIPQARPWQAIRIAVPVSMRGKIHAGMPAANTVSMVFIDRWHFGLNHFAAYLKSHRLCMQMVDRYRVGAILPLSLSFLRGLAPSGRILQWTIDVLSPPTTAVLTNIGRYMGRSHLPRDSGRRLMIGNLLLVEEQCVVPLRSGTQLGIVIINYANQLSLHLNFDPVHLSPRQASDILARFTSHITSHLDKFIEAD